MEKSFPDQTILRAIQRLSAAVLVEAYEAIHKACRPGSGPAAVAQGKLAWGWMKLSDRGPFSFLACCEMLGLDPEAGRDFARRMVGGEVSLSAVRMETPEHQATTPDQEAEVVLTEAEKARIKEFLESKEGKSEKMSFVWRGRQR